jgi:hypothetical protein
MPKKPPSPPLHVVGGENKDKPLTKAQREHQKHKEEDRKELVDMMNAFMAPLIESTAEPKEGIWIEVSSEELRRLYGHEAQRLLERAATMRGGTAARTSGRRPLQTPRHYVLSEAQANQFLAEHLPIDKTFRVKVTEMDRSIPLDDWTSRTPAYEQQRRAILGARPKASAKKAASPRKTKPEAIPNPGRHGT